MKYSLWDVLTRLKNGQLAKKKSVLIEKTKLAEELIKILWDSGYLLGYVSVNKKLDVYFKYTATGSPVITKVKALSTPGHRRYSSVKQLWKTDTNTSLLVVSTTKGLKSLYECKQLNLGGEILFIVF